MKSCTLSEIERNNKIAEKMHELRTQLGFRVAHNCYTCIHAKRYKLKILDSHIVSCELVVNAVGERFIPSAISVCDKFELSPFYKNTRPLFNNEPVLRTATLSYTRDDGEEEEVVESEIDKRFVESGCSFITDTIELAEGEIE